MGSFGAEVFAKPSVGLAYSASVRDFAERYPSDVDHIEIPFELLRHDPGVIGMRPKLPIILHCASLSVAGTEPCDDNTIREIGAWAHKTGSPWIGEHLAFITASRTEAGPHPEEYAPGEPYNIGYTVSPIMNERTINRVVCALAAYGVRFPVPILIENSPLYFDAPGTTMTQANFISRICDRTDVSLLFDLAHFVITSRLENFDPFEELERFPLHRVVEIHVSGIDDQNGGCWDNHARPAPELVHELLREVLDRVTPRAITLEYNWSSRFPEAWLSEELARVRGAIRAATK